MATFTYNSSTCESTGYSPFQLVFCGNDANLLHDLNLSATAQELGLEEVPDGSSSVEHTFRQEARIRLHAQYIDARARQEKSAKKNREYIACRRGPVQALGVEYDVDDLILYYEPQQTKIMQTDEQRLRGEVTTKRPAKWTPKWTGPHKITKKTPHDTGFKYTFFHEDRAMVMEDVANKLYPFQPWSEGITSTSWDIDYKRKYRTGEWVLPGSTVLVPLTRPYPFGITKMLNSDKDGNLTLQWMGNKYDDVKGEYLKGWVDSKGKTYYSDVPAKIEHKPYTTTMDQIILNQRDILMHDFKLTPANKLPAPILRAIAQHPKVWWCPTERKKRPKKRTNPNTEKPAMPKKSKKAPQPKTSTDQDESEVRRSQRQTWPTEKVRIALEDKE